MKQAHLWWSVVVAFALWVGPAVAVPPPALVRSSIAAAMAAPLCVQELDVRDFNIDDIQLEWYGRVQPGVMRLRNGTRYQLTDADVEWIAKMVQGESHDGDPVHAASVIWSVMQRADIFWPSVVGVFEGKLYNFIRKFSQPLRPPNPRQPRLVAKSWDELSEYSRRMALAFAYGLLPNPIPGAVDFANRNSPAGPGLEPLAWIGFRGPTTGNIFYARMVGRTSTKNMDWGALQVTSSLGSSGVTQEAFELYGRSTPGQTSTGLLGDLVPGGRALIRRITGR